MLPSLVKLPTNRLTYESAVVAGRGWGEPLPPWEVQVEEDIVGEGATDAFRALVAKIMASDAAGFHRAYIDYYDAGNDRTESYPIKDSLLMIKRLCRQYNVAVGVDLATLVKEVWAPADVLSILVHPDTTVELYGYGRAGVIYKWSNPSFQEGRTFVTKHTVGIPGLIREYYHEHSFVRNYEIQRQTVPGGSLEQYMQRMHWVDGNNPVHSYTASIHPVDNTILTEPCNLIVMQFLPGVSYGRVTNTWIPDPTIPEWVRAGARSAVATADEDLKGVGVMHNDLYTGGDNILVQWTKEDEPVIVKILDFGQATPIPGMTPLTKPPLG
jgi:serine/threonine protein kinase